MCVFSLTCLPCKLQFYSSNGRDATIQEESMIMIQRSGAYERMGEGDDCL